VISDYITLQIIASFLISYVVFAWLIIRLYKNFLHSVNRENKLKIFKIDKNIFPSLDSLLSQIKPPFIFEIAVHQIGREVNYYIHLPGKSNLNLRRVPVRDFDLYYSSGTHVGFYIKTRDGENKIDFRNIDFSKVNEIGESSLFQIIVNKDKKISARVFVSAPTPYQANEIIYSIKPAFKDFKVVESDNADFINSINARRFNHKESLFN